MSNGEKPFEADIGCAGDKCLGVVPEQDRVPS